MNRVDTTTELQPIYDALHSHGERIAVTETKINTLEQNHTAYSEEYRQDKQRDELVIKQLSDGIVGLDLRMVQLITMIKTGFQAACYGFAGLLILVSAGWTLFEHFVK